MKLYSPDSSTLEPSHKIEGSQIEAKNSFYELAKSRIKFLNSKKFGDWINRYQGPIAEYLYRTAHFKDTALFLIKPKLSQNETGEINKFIENLEIVINEDGFILDGVDYSEIIPFVAEHEIYEAWLHAKMGLGQSSFIKNLDTAHKLALRKEFFCAQKMGLSDKLFAYHIKIDPKNETLYRDILDHVKNKPEKIKQLDAINIEDLRQDVKKRSTYSTDFIYDTYLYYIDPNLSYPGVMPEAELDKLNHKIDNFFTSHKGSIELKDLDDLQSLFDEAADKYHINREWLSLKSALKKRSN